MLIIDVTLHLSDPSYAAGFGYVQSSPEHWAVSIGSASLTCRQREKRKLKGTKGIPRRPCLTLKLDFNANQEKKIKGNKGREI